MKVIVMQSVAGKTTIASVYSQDREWVIYIFEMCIRDRYTSVCSGFFHKLYAGGTAAVKDSEYYTPENLKIAEGLHGLMEEYQISLTQAILGYLTCRDFTCLPLYGPRNTADLREAMETFSIPFLREYYPEV